MAMTTASTSIRSKISYNGGERHRESRIGETAGECAAVVCCCPCGTIHILILALYRLPTGLCKKAWGRRKRRGLLKKKRKDSMERKENHWKANSIWFYTDDHYCEDEGSIGQSDAVEWDSEMWDHFYGAGFWRSNSLGNQR